MNDEQIKILTIEITKMNLQENDYLFIKFPPDFPEEGIAFAKKNIREQFPELRVLLYNVDLEFSIVHQENK